MKHGIKGKPGLMTTTEAAWELAYKLKKDPTQPSRRAFLAALKRGAIKLKMKKLGDKTYRFFRSEVMALARKRGRQ